MSLNKYRIQPIIDLGDNYFAQWLHDPMRVRHFYLGNLIVFHECWYGVGEPSKIIVWDDVIGTYFVQHILGAQEQRNSIMCQDEYEGFKNAKHATVEEAMRCVKQVLQGGRPLCKIDTGWFRDESKNCRCRNKEA